MKLPYKSYHRSEMIVLFLSSKGVAIRGDVIIVGGLLSKWFMVCLSPLPPFTVRTTSALPYEAVHGACLDSYLGHQNVQDQMWTRANYC